jgi:hypothetical protein
MLQRPYVSVLAKPKLLYMPSVKTPGEKPGQGKNRDILNIDSCKRQERSMAHLIRPARPRGRKGSGVFSEILTL